MIIPYRQTNIVELITNATYLDNKVLKSLLVLRIVSIELVLKTINCEYFEIFDASIPLLHLLQTRLIVTSRHHFAMLDLLVGHKFLEAFVEFAELILVNTFALVLAVSLTQDLDFERFLMGILSHHALQLEGITIELHDFSLSLFNIILLRILINI